MDFSLQLTQYEDLSRIQFPAMACLCEVLIDSADASLALRLGELARDEARRIEHKFSRYRDDSVVAAINHAAGAAITVDDETAGLLDFADELFALSEGRFDITSGILRRVWRFDGSDRLPAAAGIDALLPLIGWHKVRWQKPELQMAPGMEIDLGGIGKEYAVDKVFALLAAQFAGALLVNFGGDLRARGPRSDGSAWQVGVEKVSAGQPELLSLTTGAIATSGDSQRYLLRDGVRYSHILDPRTGWPVQQAPHAVTVMAASCVQAGVFSTLALMMGSDAEAFMQDQDVPFWSMR
ncbi:FAD:protein FMN transferase [Thalassolituus sp. LLYu03]|uniref:FAD:protein FMN transferase n=1 Tax=Thalassolituus sp. LLYu03 TaxID=3421656 RepID=UPI003D2DAB1C